MIVTSNFAINQTAAPNLPLATMNYDRQYLDQLTNVLRLYFNRIDATFGQLSASATTDGSSIQFANGSFYYGGSTALTANVPLASTSAIQVTSTAGFLPSGALLIDSEFISYTGITSTTFTGITRAANSSLDADHFTGAAVTAAQFPATSSVAIALKLPQTASSNGVSVDSADSTKVVHAISGIYNFQFSVQAIGFSAVENASLWLRKNGTDIANSAGIVTVPLIGSPATTNIFRSVQLTLTAGDYIQLMFSNIGSSLAVSSLPPGTAPVSPLTPGVSVSSTFVSALY
jgi:hypothetical protein